MHTQNIEGLWRHIKERVKRPGIRSKYFAGYLFLRHYQDQQLHRFFIEATRLYPTQSDTQRANQEQAPIPLQDYEADPDDPSNFEYAVVSSFSFWRGGGAF